MGLTKSAAAVDAWEEIAQNTVDEGATLDVSANYAHDLIVDLALTSVTAHTGTEVIVQVSSSLTTDEFWHNFVKFVGPTGTSATEAITNNPLAAAGTTITVADTTGFVTNGKWLFLEDATFANSEMVYQRAYSANTSITILDGVTRAHAKTAVLWDLCQQYVISLPASAVRVRVIINNCYDADGSTIGKRVRVQRTTKL